jgi:hypothetical protein
MTKKRRLILAVSIIGLVICVLFWNRPQMLTGSYEAVEHMVIRYYEHGLVLKWTDVTVEKGDFTERIFNQLKWGITNRVSSHEGMTVDSLFQLIIVYTDGTSDEFRAYKSYLFKDYLKGSRVIITRRRCPELVEEIMEIKDGLI